ERAPVGEGEAGGTSPGGGRRWGGACCLAAPRPPAGPCFGPAAGRAAAQGGAPPVTRLGTRGTQFTINDRPTFLLGISYYGGLGATEEAARRDLADARRHGFNWVRGWATWAAFGNDVSAAGPHRQ